MLQRLKNDRIRAGRFAILFNASSVFGDVRACLICNYKDLSFRVFSEQLFEEVYEYSAINSLRWNLEKQSTL
jgi:hypothetical protein